MTVHARVGCEGDIDGVDSDEVTLVHGAHVSHPGVDAGTCV